MSDATRKLRRWQRLLVREIAHRDQLTLHRRALERQIDAAQQEYAAIEHSRQAARDSATNAALCADLALIRAGESGLRRIQFDAKAKSEKVHALNAELHSCICDFVKAQQITLLIDSRINHCRLKARSESDRRVA